MGAEVKPRLGCGDELGCAVNSRRMRGAGHKLSRCGAGHVHEDGHGGTRELGHRAGQSLEGLGRA